MAMLIKSRARKPIANGPLGAGIVPHGLGLVVDPRYPERGDKIPVVSFSLGEYRLHISVEELNRTLADLRSVEAECGVKIQ